VEGDTCHSNRGGMEGDLSNKESHWGKAGIHALGYKKEPETSMQSQRQGDYDLAYIDKRRVEELNRQKDEPMGRGEY